MEEFHWAKDERRRPQPFDVFLEGEFYGFVDSWTEYLCKERNKDGSITLTSALTRSWEAGWYKERGSLPANIRRKEVWGYDGDYVVGGRLVLR